MTTAIVVDGSFGLAIAYFVIDDNAYCSDSVESIEGDLDRISNDNFNVHCLVGSVGFSHNIGSSKRVHVSIVGLSSCSSRPELVDIVDVVEIFGGEGDVDTWCVRRMFKRGAIFDLVAGV